MQSEKVQIQAQGPRWYRMKPSFKLLQYNVFTIDTDLEEKLKESQGSRIRLIVTDGVFSMDGNVAPLKEIGQLADQYNAMIFIDECHATGLFGETGRYESRTSVYIVTKRGQLL